MVLKNNRNQLTEFIHQVEKEVDVNEIKYREVKVWPIIRLFFKFRLRKKRSSIISNKKQKDNILKKIIRYSIKNIRYVKSKLLLFKIKNVNTLFVGTPHFRINFNGKEYNRYFDHSLDHKNDLLIELDSDSKKNYQNKENVFLFNNIKIEIKLQKPTGYILDELFNEQITSLLKEHQFYTDNIISELENYVNYCLSRVHSWEKILLKTKPNVIKYLGYSSNLFALNIAAHRSGIPTVDVQHGIQGKYHSVYSDWLKIPKEGYEALPNEFHCWDEFSTKNINRWAIKTSKHSAKCKGNPWIDYYKQNVNSKSPLKSVSKKKIILFTLQPFEEPLEEFVLDAIKETKHKYNWWLRFHPAQTNKSQVIDLLKQKNIYEIVNIEDASNKPLLDIFQVADLHITKTSSCILEALSFDLPSIITDKEGVDMYEDYLESEVIHILDKKNTDGFLQKIKEIMLVHNNRNDK